MEKSRFMNVTHYTVKTQYTAVDIQGYITNLWKNSDTLIKMHTMLSLKTILISYLSWFTKKFLDPCVSKTHPGANSAADNFSSLITLKA